VIPKINGIGKKNIILRIKHGIYNYYLEFFILVK